jgi:hypothetical protein
MFLILLFCFWKFFLAARHNLLQHTSSLSSSTRQSRSSTNRTCRLFAVQCLALYILIHTPAHLILHQQWIPKYLIRYTINLLIFVSNVNCANAEFILWTRLRAAGLLSLVQLMEGDLVHSGFVCMIAYTVHLWLPLIWELLDWWRPEIHTFHLSVEECWRWNFFNLAMSLPSVLAWILYHIHWYYPLV